VYAVKRLLHSKASTSGNFWKILPVIWYGLLKQALAQMTLHGQGRFQLQQYKCSSSNNQLVGHLRIQILDADVDQTLFAGISEFQINGVYLFWHPG